VTHFFSCDWGTTSFRLRRVNVADGRIVAEQREPTGIRALYSQCAPGDRSAREKIFANFLRAQLLSLAGADVAALDGVSVAVSGMASSSVGWRELPYASVPVGLDGAGIKQEVFNLEIKNRIHARIHLISGLQTATEILRGEEVEILGLFTQGQHEAIAHDGLVVLPGTHSKHVRLRNRQITDFHTYLTGELFDVLAAHSLLSASVQSANPFPPLTEAPALDAFLDGVRAAASSGLARSLFQTRTRTVLQSIPPAVNRWFLSGLLIGAEVVDLSVREPAVPLLLAAPEPLSLAYRLAFENLGLADRLAVAPPVEMAFASVLGQLMLLQSHLK
jgi:2-dehydro-3-deoxygalactonokinase